MIRDVFPTLAAEANNIFFSYNFTSKMKSEDKSRNEFCVGKHIFEIVE